MTANNVQGSNILDVLKQKMRATKEECEKFKEDLQRKLQVEISRCEEVSFLAYFRTKLVEHSLQSSLFQSAIRQPLDTSTLSAFNRMPFDILDGFAKSSLISIST